MQLPKTEESKDYLVVATALAQEFATTAAERDAKGGTAKYERDHLRESGLLHLIVPKKFGGIGETWTKALLIVREFAKVDSSIAHLLGYHYIQVIAPHLFGTPEQAQRYYSATVRNNWFWCNALNPLDKNLTAIPDGKNFRLNGVKSFCSGSVDSDILVVSAYQEEESRSIVAAIPSDRPGIAINGDWDNMGQRQTDSGSITFGNVLVMDDEVLALPPHGTPFASLRTCIAQLNMANIYLGIALGAFEEAKQYTTVKTRAWLTSEAESATQDPYIIEHYGNMWVDLSAATALTDKAGELVQAAWQEGENLTAEQRGGCAVAIASAKVLATRVGLNITSQIFEVMGARATSGQYRFDRYWRNVRTFTLHDPVAYKVRELGDWALNNQLPTPTSYS